MWKGEKPVFNRDEVRVPYTENYLKHSAGRIRSPTVGRFGGGKITRYNANENGALPRDVITIPALAGGAGRVEGVEHPTQKPLQLCDTLIKASKSKNHSNIVLVPFVGSGSECVSAIRNSCNFIGFETNKGYISIAENRIKEAMKEAKVKRENNQLL